MLFEGEFADKQPEHKTKEAGFGLRARKINIRFDITESMIHVIHIND